MSIKLFKNYKKDYEKAKEELNKMNVFYCELFQKVRSEEEALQKGADQQATICNATIMNIVLAKGRKKNGEISLTVPKLDLKKLEDYTMYCEQNVDTGTLRYFVVGPEEEKQDQAAEQEK